MSIMNILYLNSFPFILKFLHFAVVKCKYPVLPDGELLSGYGTQFHYRDVVQLGCKTGFYLEGSKTVVCGANSAWEPELPRCIRGTVCLFLSFLFRFYFFDIKYKWYRVIEMKHFSYWIMSWHVKFTMNSAFVILHILIGFFFSFFYV